MATLRDRLQAAETKPKPAKLPAAGVSPVTCIPCSARPLVSVIINAADEGPRLRATVDNLRAAFAPSVEVIVIDDATTDGCCDGIKARVLRNQTRIGCGRSKVRGQTVARGHVLFFCDAHFFHVGGDLKGMVEMVKRDGIVASPGLRNFDYDSEWNPVLKHERVFVPNDIAFGLGYSQYSLNRAGVVTPYRGLMVSCGVMVSRETLLDGMGGWNPYKSRYGSQERGFGIRAYMSGVETWVFPAVHFGHEFGGKGSLSRKHFPYPACTVGETARAAWECFGMMLSPASVSVALAPFLRADSAFSAGESMANDPEVAAERDRFAHFHKRRPDADLIRLLQHKVALPDRGGATLGDDTIQHILREASGRALELGTGSGKGTALLSVVCRSVDTVDHDARFAKGDLPGVRYHLAERDGAGGYRLKMLEGWYDTVLIDGPPGGAARAGTLGAVWRHIPIGGKILVDDGKRDRGMVESWKARYSLRGDMLETARGLWVLTKT